MTKNLTFTGNQLKNLIREFSHFTLSVGILQIDDTKRNENFQINSSI